MLKYMTDKRRAAAMLAFFRDYDGEGLPTFTKFAERMGTDTASLLERPSPCFLRAYEECRRILCDRVADGALSRRLDPSFAKFYLSSPLFGFTDEEAATSAVPFEVNIRIAE